MAIASPRFSCDHPKTLGNLDQYPMLRAKMAEDIAQHSLGPRKGSPLTLRPGAHPDAVAQVPIPLHALIGSRLPEIAISLKPSDLVAVRLTGEMLLVSSRAVEDPVALLQLIVLHVGQTDVRVTNTALNCAHLIASPRFSGQCRQR